MTSAVLTHEAGTRWHRRALAACLSAVLVVVAMVAMSPASRAIVPGIDIAVLHNGVVVGDGAAIPEGADLQLRVQYNTDEDIDGAQITITLPEGVTVPGGLPSNEAIESIVQEGNTITVTFRDPIPGDIAEGAFAIGLQAGQVDEDTDVTISWEVGGESGGVTVIIEDDVTPPTEIVDGYTKGVNPGNLDSFVLNSGSPDYQFLGLDPAIEDAVLTYTLVLNSAEARNGYPITDELFTGLGFIPGSFQAELTTYNPTETVSHPFSPTVSGNTFAGTVDVPEQSTLTIVYQVQVTDRAALEALLQTAFDERNGTPGNYEIFLPNDAVFGEEHERSVSVRLRGNIPGVGIGENFGKAGSWSLRNVVTDEDGNLQPPAEMTYTLRANLTPWDGRNPNFTLQQNVVISDTLIDQASWSTDDAEFITVSGDGPIQSLTQAAGFAGTVAEFAADEYVGQYAVIGQTLLVNVGDNDPDNPTNLSIHVRAQLDTVAGLPGSDDTTVVGGIHYPWNNQAQFHYGGGTPASRTHDAGVVELPDDREGGINDSAVFTKSGPSDEVAVSPGESAQVPYRFVIDTSREGIDPLSARIVDEIDIEIFDITDPSSIPVSGSYGGTVLVAEHFALSLDEQGHLVIELSEAGRDVVGDLAEDQEWIIDIVLTTVPFEGRETFEIYNRATLYGDGVDPDYWSDDESEATSFGDEAELRKRVHDDLVLEWTDELNALVQDGELVNDTFVYYIELIPRGNYGSAFPVTIFTREDVLPEAVEFLGFVTVDEDEVPVLDPLRAGPDELNGNVVAEYSDGVVTIRQQDGTNLDPDQGRIVTYFAVQAIDPSQPIVNEIAGSEAVITPYGDPSIDIEKWNDEGEAPEYDESGALLNDGFDGDFDETPGKPLAAGEPLEIHFTISNDGLEDLVDVVVSDELTDGVGAIQGLVCEFPDGTSGTEWEGPFEIGTQFECTGILPALVAGDTHSDTAAVTGVGIISGTEVDDADDWHAWVPQPSIDIEKWNDEGEAPEYDESGALLNDGFDGDFDEVPGKGLTAGQPLEIHFTISNDGEEDLVDIVVSDELTAGVGVIQDLVCTFPDDSEGTTWAGPFAIGAQFDCTGLLPALEAGEVHSDTAAVTGVGIHSGIEVDDSDDWHGHVPEPSIGIEKWNDEGEAPEYDESGALLNDGYAGDFDEGPGKQLTAGQDLQIHFTITNDGVEDLIDLAVIDELTDGEGEIQDLVCTFPDGSTGISWAGPFAVGTQFECTGTLPGLDHDDIHANTAQVTGTGAVSGIVVGDEDVWHGFVPQGPGQGGLPASGLNPAALVALALLGLLAGGGALLYRRGRTDAMA